MHTLARNKQPVWYALLKGKTERLDENGFRTGQYDLEYEEPVLAPMNIRWDVGAVRLEQQGLAASGKRRMVTGDMDCPITLGTVLWVNEEPQYPDNTAVVGYAVVGQAIVGEIGPRTCKPNYYVCETPQKSLNHIAYIVEEVSVGGVDYNPA